MRPSQLEIAPIRATQRPRVPEMIIIIRPPLARLVTARRNSRHQRTTEDASFPGLLIGSRRGGLCPFQRSPSPQAAWPAGCVGVPKSAYEAQQHGNANPLGAPSGRHGLDRLAHHTQRSSHMHAEHAIGNFVARTIETAAVAIAIFVSGFLDSADIPVTMQSKHR